MMFYIYMYVQAEHSLVCGMKQTRKKARIAYGTVELRGECGQDRW